MSGERAPAMPANVARLYDEQDRWEAILHDPWATLASRAHARIKLTEVEQALAAHEA